MRVIKSGDAPADVWFCQFGIKDLFLHQRCAVAGRVADALRLSCPSMESTGVRKLWIVRRGDVGSSTWNEFAMGSSNVTSVYAML